MSLAPRYAIYYAPPLQSAFWSAASIWLGWDAARRRPLIQPDINGLADVDLDRLTKRPRRYGFHATLKAPFELTDGMHEDALCTAVKDIASEREPFELPLKVSTLHDFIALRPDGTFYELRDLHETCVQDLEPFRAMLGAEDIERRRKSGLTRLQDRRMLEWGYPFIFEDFRFHMTLTCRIPDAYLRETIQSALETYFAPYVLSGHHIGGIAIFKQNTREDPFYVLKRFDFGSAHSQSGMSILSQAAST
ncbi:MAG: DUF1045 domain-containing protein [Pseudomonadota bacterium]